ncbi:MAG: hypothetical protein COB29_14715 [Sulfitobacter sp.]|nr:MAG: hypothetical protein COB29_14715 [Sulfitobacter sp.]
MIKSGTTTPSLIDRAVYSFLGILVKWGRELEQGIQWLEKKVLQTKVADLSITENGNVVQRVQFSPQNSNAEWAEFVLEKNIRNFVTNSTEYFGVLHGESVLFRTISLPIEARHKLPSTVRFHAEAMAPIAFDKLLFGWSHSVQADDKIKCTIGIVRKEDLVNLQTRISEIGIEPSQVDILNDENGQRLTVWKKKKQLVFALNLGVFVLIALLSMMVALNDMRLSERRNIRLSQFDEEIQKVKVTAREVVVLSSDLQEQQEIQTYIKEKLYADNIILLLDQISGRLDGSTWVSSISIEQIHLVISGYTEDVTQVQNTLENLFPKSIINITAPVIYDKRAKAGKFAIRIDLDNIDAIE